MALEGTYPIMIDGALIGKLTVKTVGASTCFDAVCKPQEGLLRISVYGGGREGYLGILAPEGEQLCLHKTLSRTALRDFPREIGSVERSGLSAAPEQEPEAEVPLPVDAPLMIAEKPACSLPMPAAEPEPRETDEASETPPCEQMQQELRQAAAEPPEELFWYSSPDGALVCFDGARSLIALPQGDERIPEGYGGHRRVIDGREYIVYITKNGRIIH